MTALATIFALTPMALGVTGGGGFISQPLAIVVVGGLVSSTALTLILVPVLYRLVEGGRERRRLLKALAQVHSPAPHRGTESLVSAARASRTEDGADTPGGEAGGRMTPTESLDRGREAATVGSIAHPETVGHASHDSGSSGSQDWTTGAIPKIRGRRAAN
jgi:HAE1 family hydrophobic/amphiphilic exporter-1